MCSVSVFLRCVTAVLFTRSRTWYTIIVKCCSNVANIVQNVWEKLESITRAHCLCLVHFILICGNLSQWNDGDNEQRMLAHLAKEKKYQQNNDVFSKVFNEVTYRLAKWSHEYYCYRASDAFLPDCIVLKQEKFDYIHTSNFIITPRSDMKRVI